MIEAFITNAGKYAEGELRGDWLRFPTTKEDVQALLSRIGVDGTRHQEYFITDYKTDIDGLGLGEHENIDELNYFATLLSEMDDFSLDTFQAAVAHGDYTESVKDLINLAQNHDCYDYHPGVGDDDELGRYLVDDLEMEKLSGAAAIYFDYEAYGRDYRLNTGGIFTPICFVSSNRNVDFIEHYSGREDVPDEHRVFAYPPPPGRELNVDNAKITQSTPIADNYYVKQLLEVMQSNNMPGAKDLQTAVNQVTAMENHLATMVSELGAMRRELAEAQKMNHPIQTALSKAVVTLQAQALDIRDKLSGLKQNIVVGCRNALAAFQEKGLSALRNIADFLKIRPALESLQKGIDKGIRHDERAIQQIEKVSAEFHEAGRHIKNIGRTMTGKEPIQEAKSSGKLAKALSAHFRADRACLNAMNICVGKAIGAVERLEKTEHRPPIKDTIDRLNKEIAQAGREAPTRQRPAPEHTGR